MKLSDFFCISLIVVLVNANTFPQLLLGWKNYSDQKKVKSAVEVDNSFWAATEGGAFYFNKIDSSFNTYTKTDGLSGSALTAISIDRYGKIWFGSLDGTIDIYNPANNSFKRISDIYNSGKSKKQINSFVVKGDTIFTATEFGLSLINVNDYSFYDTYFKYGSFPSYISVNNVLIDGLIYVATSSGVAIQKPGATNLVAPESWNVYTISEGLRSNNCYKLAIFKDSVIVSSDIGFSVFNGVSWETFLPSFNSANIKDIFVKGDSLYILSLNNLYVYSNGEITMLETGLETASSIVSVGNNEITITTNQGLLVISNNKKIYYYPNGPYSNLFSSLSVDASGNLWAASGTDVTGVGFYKYDQTGWENFNVASNPELLVNSFHKVYSAPDNTVYAMTWGRGFVTVENGSVITTYYKNTPMLGIRKDPDFLAITGISRDSQGNTWILSYDGADRKILAALTPDSTWYLFDNPSYSGLEKNYGLIVDQYNTKWFYSTDNTKPGLYYFNENKTFNTTQDDKYGFLSMTNGLNNSTITALVQDKRGDLWVGSGQGVNIIYNTNQIISTQSPQLKITSVYSLRQQSINCIVVDPINQKWVGTNQGLFVVSSDGTNLIAAFDSKNSPLISDQVKSLTVDEKRGVVYAGVDGGLTAFFTSAKSPEESFSELFFYPSPFIVGDGQTQLTIEGLIKESDIKIISLNGNLINQFSSPGGRIAFWDGKDLDGKFVSSGVYYVVAYDKEGNNIITGKIAVVKK